MPMLIAIRIRVTKPGVPAIRRCVAGGMRRRPARAGPRARPQAVAAGTPRVLCCAEIDEALALKAELGEGLTGGERNGVRIQGFDVGASPRDFVEPLGEPLILSTTNGTRAILSASAQADEVLIGSLLNLGAVASAL